MEDNVKKTVKEVKNSTKNFTQNNWFSRIITCVIALSYMRNCFELHSPDSPEIIVKTPDQIRILGE